MEKKRLELVKNPLILELMLDNALFEKSLLETSKAGLIEREGILRDTIAMQRNALEDERKRIKRLEDKIRSLKRKRISTRLWNAFIALAGVELHT